ncbi:hypothetical protein QOT17_017924 [Balamuthia mandrillaris]
MPSPNNPICALMTRNRCHVTVVIDSSASQSFMDLSIIDLVCVKTKQANYTIKLEHQETTTTCAAEMKPLAIGFGEHHFHYMFSHGVTDIPIDHPEEPLLHSKDHITWCQHQRLVKAVKEHICKHILKAIEKYLQENKVLPTIPFPWTSHTQFLLFIALSSKLHQNYIHMEQLSMAQHFQHLMDVITAAIAEFTSHYINNLVSFPKVWKNLLSNLSTLSLQDYIFVRRSVCLGTNASVSSVSHQLHYYLHDFILMFTQLIRSLDALWYIKVVCPHWNQDCQDAFDALKRILSNPPKLSLYNPSLPLLEGTDASQFGVGAVFYQVGPKIKHQYIRVEGIK